MPNTTKQAMNLKNKEYSKSTAKTEIILKVIVLKECKISASYLRSERCRKRVGKG